MCVDVELEKIARATTGFSGADLANLINQAALRGSIEDREAVTYEDLEYARYVWCVRQDAPFWGLWFPQSCLTLLLS